MNNLSPNIRKHQILPKGLLVAIGGNEDKEFDMRILYTILSLVKKQKKTIEIITTASRFSEDAGRAYLKTFTRESDHTVGLMHIATREQANDLALLERISAADVIFFTGGYQLRITSILGGSLIEKEIHRKYEQEYFIIAGTSAGASAMSRTMIYGGEGKTALRKGTVKVSAGMGLIDNVVIDTHFVERGRFSRLMEVVCMNSGITGIGLGEDAAVVIEHGYILRAIGGGVTVIMDGHHLKHTNVADIDFDDPIAIENLTIHTIVNGYGYDLSENKYLKPEDLEHMNRAESEAIYP